MINKFFQQGKSFVFDGKSSLDFFCIASQGMTYNIAEIDYNTYSIAGRNGDLYESNKRLNNIDIELDCFIAGDNFFHHFFNLMAWLMSRKGYCDFYTASQPYYVRQAFFKGGTKPTVTNHGGSFTLTFSCDPRRFLTDSRSIEKADKKIFNSTLFDAKPRLFIPAASKGQTIKINSTVITIKEIQTQSSTDPEDWLCIDSETMSCYKGGVNKNMTVGFNEDSEDVFPILHPGTNKIETEIQGLHIQKNFWTA